MDDSQDTSQTTATDSQGGDQYQGVEFTPPEPLEGEEGDATVHWKKVGDRYTFTELDGKPLEAPAEEQDETPSANDEIDSMAGANANA